MPLMSFSTLIPEVQSGKKRQTTRSPRKTPLKKGDVLHVYHNARAKKTCHNCVRTYCQSNECLTEASEKGKCKDHTNKLGEAIITDVFNTTLFTQTAQWLEWWANKDGFGSFAAADEWFKKTYGELWTFKHWDIVTFQPNWVK